MRRADVPRTVPAAPTPLSADLISRVRQHLIGTGLAPDPAAVSGALRACGVVGGPATTAALVAQLTDEMTGAGVLQPLLQLPGVTDVLVNGPGRVWVDDAAGLHPTDVLIPDEPAVRRLAQRLAAQAGRRLDEASPFVDARLPDGVRLHAVLGTVSAPGTLISLRVPAATALTLADLTARGALPAAAATVLRAIVAERVSFLVTGGTGSGKTTLLRALLATAPPAQRILVVEESAELAVAHGHVVALEGRPATAEGVGRITLSDLLRQAMRMRPDRIVVGEVRGAEVQDLLAAMNTGHEGCAGTIHANSPELLPERIEALALATGMPRPAVHAQVAAGLQAAVHIERTGAARRRVTGIWAPERDRAGLITMRQVWEFTERGVRLRLPDSWLGRTIPGGGAGVGPP